MTHRTASCEAITTLAVDSAPFVLAQVDRPTEEAADLTDRPLPSLWSVVELLRTARRTGDRHGVRLFSRMIDRVLDVAYMPAPVVPGLGGLRPGDVLDVDVAAVLPAAAVAAACGSRVLVAAGARASVGVIDVAEREDDEQGYEDADDALLQWAAQPDQGTPSHRCSVCGQWTIDCVCRGTRSGR